MLQSQYRDSDKSFVLKRSIICGGPQSQLSEILNSSSCRSRFKNTYCEYVVLFVGGEVRRSCSHDACGSYHHLHHQKYIYWKKHLLNLSSLCSSVGLAKAALEAINGFNLFGNQVLCIIPLAHPSPKTRVFVFCLIGSHGTRSYYR